MAAKATALRAEIDATFARLAAQRRRLLEAMRLADGEDVA